MTAEFRHKLLNWLVSMGIVSLTTAVAIASNWFRAMSELAVQDPTDLIYILGPLMDGLSIYFMVAPFFLFWHFFDLIEKSSPESSWASRLVSYRAILWLMLPAIVLLLLMSLRVWHYNSCDVLPNALFHQCVVHPSYWFFIPWGILMGLAFLICIIKAGFSMASQIKKS